MIFRRLGAGLLLAALTPLGAAAQSRPDAERGAAPGPRAYVRDAGPGLAGRLLREVLSRPHTIVVAPDTGIVFSRRTDAPTTLLVVGGPARLEGRVRGDFIVLGDLVLRPGAVVDGRAIAFGGAVLGSSLAVVRGERISFRDVGFRATVVSPGTYALDYRALSRQDAVPVLSLPGLFGVGIPGYDRVDGLSLGIGPEVALDTGRVRIDPTLTYRSQLGAVDPGVSVRAELGRRTAVEVIAGRGTFTNDDWMRGDLVNAASTLWSGDDLRNYYRADRADATLRRAFETTRAIVTPMIGARVERSWSAARDSLAPSTPWGFLGRENAVDGMRRPNPAVTGGTITSALAGVEARVLGGPIAAHGTLRLEVPVAAPAGEHFAQATVDGRVSFPAFLDHTFAAAGHFVATAGRAPSQRYAYVGGGPTVPTLRVLEQGGDRLVWLESQYTVPVHAVRLPFVDYPSVSLRHIVAGAGAGRLPPLTQNVGPVLSVGPLHADFLVDPARPARHDFGVWVGMP